MRRILVAVAAASSWALVAVGSAAADTQFSAAERLCTNAGGFFQPGYGGAAYGCIFSGDVGRGAGSGSYVHAARAVCENADRGTFSGTDLSDTGNSSTFLCATPE